MTETSNHVPGLNEPSPDNVRLSRTQAGTAGSNPHRPEQWSYGQVRYADGEGPAANVKLPNGPGSGLSGLPEANAGNVPALFNDPDTPPGDASNS